MEYRIDIIKNFVVDSDLTVEEVQEDVIKFVKETTKYTLAEGDVLTILDDEYDEVYSD